MLLIESFETLATNGDPGAVVNLLDNCLDAIQTNHPEEPLRDFFGKVVCLVNSEPCKYLDPLNRFLAHICSAFKKPDEGNPEVTSKLLSLSSTFLSNFSRCVVGPLLRSIANIPQMVHLIAYFVEVLLVANKCDVAKSFLGDILSVHGAAAILLTDCDGYRFLQKLFIHFNLHVGPLALTLVDHLHAFIRDCSGKTMLPAGVEACTEMYDACEILFKVLQTYSAKASSGEYMHLGNMASERLTKQGAGRQEQQPQAYVMSFSEKQLHCFGIVGVKSPSTFRQLKDTSSCLEVVKFGLLKRYLEFTIFPNHEFHKLALNFLPEHEPERPLRPQPTGQSVEQEPKPNSDSTNYPLDSPATNHSDSFPEFGDDLGPWTILLSDKAVAGYHNLRSKKSLNVVKKKLQELASGVWTSDNAKPLVGGPMHRTSFGIQVYEAKTFRNQRIIWQVDVAYVQRLKAYAQVIKVWEIGNHKDVQKTMDKYLWMVQLGYSEQHKKRCGMRSSSKNGKHGERQPVYPLIFESDIEAEEVVLNKLAEQTLSDEDLLQLHNLRVTTKFIPLSKTLIRTLLAGSTDFAFSVSRQEDEIIEYPSSAIVIGRSGTGKTTTIMFRMLGLFQAYHRNASECLYKSLDLLEPKKTHLHQIFLTQSAALCTRVRAHFQHLLESTDRARLSEKEIISIVERRLTMGQDDTEDVMIEDDDGKELVANVPLNMTELRDEHFPLFLTVSKFLEMLEVTYNIKHLTAGPHTRMKPATRSLTTRGGAEFKRFRQNDMELADMDEESEGSGTDTDDAENVYAIKKEIQENFDIQQAWAHYVTYEVFERKYWLQINKRYTKNLDCALVFSEIMSVIKGSELVLSTDQGYLSRETYIALSQRMYPSLRYARETVYEIFEQYQKLKARHADYDAPDRSFAVLRAINKNGYHGTVLHEIYVDECQDNNICDYAVLMKLISDPNGLFFAGDTAQAVARGSLFRFADLSSLVYRNEHQNPQVQAGHRKPVQPRLFQLTTNYRSHNGILQLGANVIQLLHHFFPCTIDVLDKERGIVDGPKPIIFGNFFADKFLDVFCLGDTSNQFIEFGAEQCIIVRDEAAKEKLPDRVRNMALVMTIYESKGLEFTDTLLYNFWQDSPAQKKWKVVLSTLTDSKGEFNHEKHAILSDELKQLYVAITRARSHLWIFDENTESSEPMKKVWISQELVQVVNEGDELPSLGRKSSSTDWNNQGRNMFERRQYEHAVFCFVKSGNREARELSEAYLFREKARRLASQSNDRDAIKDAFVKAARAFDKSQRPLRAAECYQDVEMHREAGECFKRAKMFQQAVLAFKLAGCFDEAMNVLESEPNEISADVAQKVRRLARIYYSKTQQHDKALKLSLSLDEMIKSYMEHNMLSQLADLYKKNKMYIKAGDTFRLLDKLQDAAIVYAEDTSQQGMVSALECYSTLANRNSHDLLELRNEDESFTAKVSSFQSRQRAIVSKADHIVDLCSDQNLLNNDLALKSVVREITIFRSQLDRSLNSLRECAEFFDGNSIVNQYRALEMYFGFALEEYGHEPISMSGWKADMQLLEALCNCVFALLRATPQSSKSENWEELFCVDTNNIVAPTVDRRVHMSSPLIPILLEKQVHENSFVYNMEDQTLNLHDELLQPIENDPSFRLCSYDRVRSAAQKLLCRRLWQLIVDVGNFAKTLKWFQEPCINQLVLSSCSNSGCKYEHINCLDPKMFHERKSLLLLQVNLIHNLSVLYHRYGFFLLDAQGERYRPSQRVWKEKWVDATRFHTMEMESAYVLRIIGSEVPPIVKDELANLITRVWMKEPNWGAPDVYKVWGDFSNIMQAILLIQADMVHRTWMQWIKRRLRRSESQAARTIPYPPPGMIPGNHGRYYWMVKRFFEFFESLNQGDVVAALNSGHIFLRYCFQELDSLVLDPWHLVFLLEYTTTLIIFIKSGGHNVLLPRSFLLFFVTDNIDSLLHSSISEVSQNSKYGEAYCSRAHDLVLKFYTLLASRFGLNKTKSQVLLARVIRLSIILSINNTSQSRTSILKFYKDQNIGNISSPLFSKYFEANSWVDIMGVLQSQYNNPNGMDELLLVKQEGKVAFYPFASYFPSIFVIRYRDAEEFRAALGESRGDGSIYSPVTGIETHKSQRTFKGSEPVSKVTHATFHNIQTRNNEPIKKDDAHDLFTSRANPIFHEAATRIQHCFRKYKSHRMEVARGTAHADPGLQEVFAHMSGLARRLPESPKRWLYAVMLRGLVTDLYHEISRCKVTVDSMLNGVQENMKISESDELEWWLERSDEYKEKHDLLQCSLTTLVPENPDHIVVQPDQLRRNCIDTEKTLQDIKAWVEETAAQEQKGRVRKRSNAGGLKKKNGNGNGNGKKEKRPALNISDI